MKKVLPVYLTDVLWEWLQKRKEETGTSAAEMIRVALRDYIQKQDQESK